MSELVPRDPRHGLPAATSGASRAPGQDAPPTGRPPSTFDIRGALRRRRKLVGLTTAGVVLSAALLTALLPRSYSATAALRIDEGPRTLPALDVMRGLGDGGDVAAEIVELESRSLAEDAVDSLGLRLVVTSPRGVARNALLRDLRAGRGGEERRLRATRRADGAYAVEDAGTGAVLATAWPGSPVRVGDVAFTLAAASALPGRIQFELLPFADVVDAAQKRLRVSRPTRDASVVTVAYSARDPETARDVPNVLATLFIHRRLGAQQGETRGTAGFLRDQIDKLAGQLTTAEEELRAFRERARIVNLPEQGRNEVGNFAQVQAQRAATEAERASLGRLLEDARSQADRQRRDPALAASPSPYRSLVAFPTLFRNQAAAELLAALSSAEDRRAELLTRRTAIDPDVQQLSGRVRDIEEQLRGLTTTYLNGLRNQVGALDASLATSQRQLARFPEQQVELARLERRAKGLEDISLLLQTRLKEAEIAQSAGDGSVRLVDAASLPRKPSSPKPLLNLVLATFAGLALGAGLATARELNDRSVHSRQDLLAATGATVLGFVPLVQYPSLRARGEVASGGSLPVPARGDDTRLASAADEATWALVTAFQRLATNIAFARADASVKTLLLTSPLPGDGKTTVSVNLAITLARSGRRVLLVDADLRRASVHLSLGVTRSPGLAELLQAECAAASACRRVDVGGSGALFVLTAGSAPADPSSLFSPRAVSALMESIAVDFDLVVIDSSPINVVADAALLANEADAVLVVARAGVTTAADLAFAMEQLSHARAPVIGTVLNSIDLQRDATYDGAYRYYGRPTAYSSPSTT